MQREFHEKITTADISWGDDTTLQQNLVVLAQYAGEGQVSDNQSKKPEEDVLSLIGTVV